MTGTCGGLVGGFRVHEYTAHNVSSLHRTIITNNSPPGKIVAKIIKKIALFNNHRVTGKFMLRSVCNLFINDDVIRRGQRVPANEASLLARGLRHVGGGAAMPPC